MATGRRSLFSRGRGGLMLLVLLLCLAGCGGTDYTVDEELGLGTAGETRKKDGIVYAETDRDWAVIFALPNQPEVDLTAFEEDYEAVYLSGTALDRAGKLAALTLGSSTACDPVLSERLAALDRFSCPEISLAADWAMTLAQAEQINDQRAERGLTERIEPSLPMCLAARERVGELEERYEAGTRPDGRDSVTALSDRQIPCEYMLTCIGTGATMAELTAGLDEDAQNACWAYQEVVFSQMGLSMARGGFDGAEQYGSCCLFALPELTGVTLDGLTYEKADGGIRITGCIGDARQVSVPTRIAGYEVTSIAPDAFRDRPELLSVGLPALLFLRDTLTADLFAGCDSLRAVLLPSFADPSVLELPEGCRVFPYLMDMVDRQEYTHLAYLYVEDEAVYGMVQESPDYPAVLMAVPGDRNSFTVPEEVGGHRVAYIHGEALSQAPGLKELTVPDACAVEPGLLETLLNDGGFRLRCAPGSMTDAMSWTVRLARAVNQARADMGLPSVSPDLTLTQMAWGRAKDMNEVTDEQRANHQRPDGGDWIDIVAEPDIPYTVQGEYNHYVLAEDYQGVRSEEQLTTLILPQFTQTCASTTLGEGVAADLVGMGLFYGEYQGEQAIYAVCVCGYREEDHTTD